MNGRKKLMKQVVLYIKNMLLALIIFMCVFQMVDLVFAEDTKESFMNEVDVLRENTSFIINANPSCCSLIRDEEVKDSLGNIVSYEKVELPEIMVRFATVDSSQIKETLVGTVEIGKIQSITAFHYDDIRRGDVLKSNTGFLYKVIDIESVTLGGNDEKHCYKKSGLVEWLVL